MTKISTYHGQIAETMPRSNSIINAWLEIDLYDNNSAFVKSRDEDDQDVSLNEIFDKFGFSSFHLENSQFSFVCTLY